jgi:hypothetical protein
MWYATLTADRRQVRLVTQLSDLDEAACAVSAIHATVVCVQARIAHGSRMARAG